MNARCMLLIFLIFSACYFQEAHAQDNGLRKQPLPEWELQTSGPVYASPVVSENIIYAGSVDSNLYAVDLLTGRLVWKFKTGGDIRSTALIDQNGVIVVSGDGCLYSIDKRTHQLKWKFKSRGDKKYELFSFADYFQSSPAIKGDTLFFGSGDGFMYAVDKNNGNLIWEFKTNAVLHSSPVVYGSRLCFGSFDGYLYSLNTKDGSLIWRFKSVGQRYFPKGEMQGSPLFFDNMIFAGSRDYNLYAVDAATGTGIWNKQFPKGWAMAKPAVKDSVLYVGTSDDRVLVAFDPYYGRVLWQTDVKFNVFGSCLFSGNMICLGTLIGRLYGIDIRTGKVIWQINSKLYTRNRLKYFKEDDSYRDDIGSVIQKNDDFLTMYHDLGAIFSTPAVSGDYLIVTSTDGKIYAYKNSH